MASSPGEPVLTLSGTPDLDHVARAVETQPGLRRLVVDVASLDGPDNRTAAILASLSLEAQRIGADIRLESLTDDGRARLERLGIGDMYAR